MATIRQRVEEILKTGWFSNFQLNMILRTSSADREARRVRENPPAGYKFITRKKKIEARKKEVLLQVAHLNILYISYQLIPHSTFCHNRTINTYILKFTL